METCHEAEGLVDNGLVIFDSVIFNMVNAGVSTGKHDEPNCKDITDRVVIVHPGTNVVPW